MGAFGRSLESLNLGEVLEDCDDEYEDEPEYEEEWYDDEVVDDDFAEDEDFWETA